MSIEQNKIAVRRLYDEVWNKGNLLVLDELMSPTVVIHLVTPGLPPAIEGFRQYVKMFRGAFPDVHFSMEDTIVEAEKVAVRWVATGTHKGKLRDILPTGKKGTIPGMTIMRFDPKGMIVEYWVVFDQLNMMQQLGVMPQLVPA